MSNVQSYNALIDRFHAFASGHFILKRFSHGQIEVSDLEKFGEYPFMHVVPSNVSYSKGMKTFSFQIVLADLPRDKEDKPEYQREVLSDLQRIAEDLVAEITNHRVLFGDLITVQNVTLEPFLEEFHHTLTGWTISLDLLVPYYWDACSIPAEWNDMWESSTGGTGSILTFIDSIVRDENGNVSLVNDEATPAPNYYYGTDDEGVRGWYLTTDNIGLTCETIGDCQTIIDIEAAIDALEEEIVLKADITSISVVGFSNDYNDLSNLPTIPTATSDLTNDSGFITIGDVPAQVNADWNSVSGVSEIFNKPTIPAAQIQSDWNQTNNVLLDFIKNKPTIPTSLPPTGAAGGDLTGTYPNPTVHRVHGVDFQSGAPAVDDTWIYVSTPFGTQPFQWQHSKLKTSQVQNDSTVTGTNADDALEHLDSTKQATLVSGTNIKTVNSNSLLGAGNVSVGTVTSVAALTLGTTGTDLSSTVATGTTTPVITLNVPTASAANRGALSAADWSTFNGKFTLPSLTSGSVLFSNGTTIAQNNANFFWDNTNSRLGIGTVTPANKLHIFGASATTPALVFTTANRPTAMSLNYNDTAHTGYIDFANIFYITRGNGTTFPFYISANSNVLINSLTDAGYKLDVNGTLRVIGATTLGTTSASNITTIATSGSSNILNVTNTAGTFVFGVDSAGGYAQPSTANRGMWFYNSSASAYIGAAASGCIAINTTSPNASAILDVVSTTKGILFPRMTTTQKNAIASPASGLVVYDTTLGKLCVRGAAAWETITSL